MNEAWRLCRRPFADLRGEGAAQFGGRWNSRGNWVVYLAEHPALAVLEVMVHLDLPIELLPEDYVLVRVVWPEAWQLDDVPDSPSEPAQVGDAWLREARAPILSVPSSIVPRSRNVLLNPRHEAASAARIAEIVPFAWDPRLV